MSFFEPYKNGYLLRIKLAPNAAKNVLGADVFCDVNGAEYLKACVTATPEKGKANKELLKLLSKTLDIAVSNFEIVVGQTEHLKKIYLKLPICDDLSRKMALLQKEK